MQNQFNWTNVGVVTVNFSSSLIFSEHNLLKVDQFKRKMVSENFCCKRMIKLKWIVDFNNCTYFSRLSEEVWKFEALESKKFPACPPELIIGDYNGIWRIKINHIEMNF